MFPDFLQLKVNEMHLEMATLNFVPLPLIEQIARATRTAVAEPTYQRLLIDAGIEPVLDSNPEKLRQTLAADVALWAPVVQKLGLKID